MKINIEYEGEEDDIVEHLKYVASQIQEVIVWYLADLVFKYLSISGKF